MLVSVALAFLAASAAPADASQPASATPVAPAVKPRKICRTEAVIGSLTPKRVCAVAPQREAPKAPAGAQGGAPQQKPASSEGATSGL